MWWLKGRRELEATILIESRKHRSIGKIRLGNTDTEDVKPRLTECHGERRYIIHRENVT